MCSIMCYCSDLADYDRFVEGFSKTTSRGPDSARIIDTGHGLMGFQRLSIMGLTPEGMQPFSLHGNHIVCNGEIYGFRPLKQRLIQKGYHFSSDSDCEILLPLYEEFGTNMFSMLDAEYALVLYDASSQSYIAARDPIGIRPLFYGYDKNGAILFASEAKNLVELTDEVHPFPPGHYYKDGAFVCYRDITDAPRVEEEDIDVICRAIHDKLVAGVEKRLDSDAPLGFLLSGGAGFLSGLRHLCLAAEKAHPHLCRGHGSGCHRFEICQGSGRLHRKRTYRNHHHQRTGHPGASRSHTGAGNL